MSHRSLIVSMIAWVLVPIASGGAFAGDKGPATCEAVEGVLLAKTPTGWQALGPKQSAPTDTLLVALFESVLQTKSGAVTLKMTADIGHHGPLPVLESAIRLHANAQADLDFSLDRGLVVLSNTRKEGAVQVVIRLLEKPLHVTLAEPGAKVGVEFYGRHAPGTHSLKDDEPVVEVLMLAVSGHIEIKGPKHTVALTAPPGPALLNWSSLTQKIQVQNLDKFPEELKRNKEEQKRFEQLCRFATQLAEAERGKALDKMIQSDKTDERLVAVTAFGALDELDRLGQALTKSPHADVRQHAILVLRHWLGRQPGQIAVLLKKMQEKGHKEAHAKTVAHLLVGFDKNERLDPDTYDLLIDQLAHSSLGVRELAHWHLVRLVPQGKAFAFDANASAEQRQAAVAQWRKLIPAGKLPPSASP